MTIDITSPEDRANIFSDLSAIAKFCVSEDEQSQEPFKLLFDIWEHKVSKKLWDLCYWNDYYRCANVILQAAVNSNNIPQEAQLLGEIGWAYMESEDYRYAQAYFQESLQKYRSLKDFREECKLLRYLAMSAHRQQKLAEALEYCNQAQEILQTKRSQIPVDHKLAFLEAELPGLMGCIYLDLREFSASYQHIHLSLKNYQDLLEDYPSWKSWYQYYVPGPLLDLGQWYFLQKDYQQARRYYQDCFVLSKEISRQDKIAEVLLSLAELAEAEGDPEEAIKLASESESIAGIEVPAVRDRAALFKEKLLSKVNGQL